MVTLKIDWDALARNVIDEIQSQLEANGSVQSGELLRSWKYRKISDGIEVFSGVEYAEPLQDRKPYIFLGNIRHRITKNLRGNG